MCRQHCLHERRARSAASHDKDRADFFTDGRAHTNKLAVFRPSNKGILPTNGTYQKGLGRPLTLCQSTKAKTEPHSHSDISVGASMTNVRRFIFHSG
jgi:hypothetical protein